MTDWDQLREVGDDVAPPPFDSLVRTARQRDRRARAITATATVALLVGLGIGVGLTNDDDGTIQPAEPPSTEATEPTDEGALPEGVVALPAPDVGEDSATLEAGRYRIPLSDTLAFEIEVPDETYAHDDGLFIATGPVILKTEVAGEYYGVPGDPCTDHTIEPVGPTVDDLVEAIRNEPVYRTTGPEPAELGGAEGVYLEIRVARSYDASQCEGGGIVATPGYGTTSIAWEPPYFGKWWILDVDGQRVVVVQNCGSCSADEFDSKMLESISFIPTT